MDGIFFELRAGVTYLFEVSIMRMDRLKMIGLKWLAYLFMSDF